MKQLLIFLFLTSLLSMTKAAAPISNMTWEHLQNEEVIKINFNLNANKKNKYYKLKLSAACEGNPIKISPKAIYADQFPEMTAGKNKELLWDLSAVPPFYGSLEITLTADPIGELTATEATASLGPSNKKSKGAKLKDRQMYGASNVNGIPIWAGLGGIFAAGGMLTYTGLQTKTSAMEEYAIYTENVDPNDPIYNGLSREIYYDEANSQHKKGRWMIIGGGTILAAGTVILIQRIFITRKMKKSGFTLSPQLDFEMAETRSIRPTVGLLASFNF